MPWDAIVNGVTNVAQGFGHQYERNKNWHYQKNRLQYLVKDAKAAGIHPIYALGGGAPNINSGVNMPGAVPIRGIDHALREKQRAPERKALHEANLDLIKSEAEKNRAIALSAMQTMPESTGNTPQNTGATQTVPAKVVTTPKDNSARSAGDNPFWMTRTFLDLSSYGLPLKVKAYMPYSEEGPAEALEGVGGAGATVLGTVIMNMNLNARALQALNKQLNKMGAKWWKNFLTMKETQRKKALYKLLENQRSK